MNSTKHIKTIALMWEMQVTLPEEGRKRAGSC